MTKSPAAGVLTCAAPAVRAGASVDSPHSPGTVGGMRPPLGSGVTGLKMRSA